MKGAQPFAGALALAAWCTIVGAGLARSADIRQLTADAAREAGVPVEVAHRLVHVESSGRASLRGRAGEYGLTQIKCQTARDLGFRGPCAQLLDPATNLKWGLKHARKALDRGSIGYHQSGLNAKRVSPKYVAKFREIGW